MIKFCILPMSRQYKCGAHTLILLFQILAPFLTGDKKNIQRLISRINQSKEAIMRLKIMAIMAWKKRKESSSKIPDQNGGKYHKKKKQASHVAHGSEEDYQETKKFHVVSNKDQFKTDLPPELVFYATTQFKKYIPERSIHDGHSIQKKNKNNSLTIYEILGKIQKKTLWWGLYPK